VREEGLSGLVSNPVQRSTMERAQAFMAVLEGYAEHVMDAAGKDLIATLPELREGLNRRRRERTGLLRVIERLLGFDLKLRQYELGKAFCDGVVERGGIAALNQVWTGPAALPSLQELEDPAGWLDRVLRSAA
jgi:putative hydrolase